MHRPHRLPNIAPPGALLKRSSAPPSRTAKAEGERSKDYLALVRRLPCLHCGMEPSEAAHVRYASAAHGKASGLQRKPEDRWAVPLCAEHHRLARDAQHNRGEREFWESLDIDPLRTAEQLWAQRHDPPAMTAVAIRTISERRVNRATNQPGG